MKDKDFEIIYQKYYQALLLYAYSLTKNLDDAKDLVANTFVKAFLSFEDGNIKAWLYRVLKNEFYNFTKKQKRFVDSDLEKQSLSGEIIKGLIKEEQKRWLYQQIYQLPKIERQIMLLSLQDDLDDNFISQMLELNLNNLRVIRHRIKKKLIKQAKEEGYL